MVKKSTIKATDYIAKRLKKETNCCFGVTGGAIMNLFDSFDKAGFKIINNHHEQASAMAADAYARVSGKLGLCVVTSGPGATNTITGIGCSWYDSIQTLTIAGQVPTGNLKYGKLRQRGFQETDTVTLFKSITKFSKQMRKAEEVEADLEKAIGIAKENRKGPTFLDLCDDVQRSKIKGKQPRYINKTLPKPNKRDIHRVIKLIKNSKKPLFIIGGGAKSDNITKKETIKLINKLGIPTFLTWGAMDLLPHDHKLNCRDFGVTSQRIGNFAIKNADLLICIGARLETHIAVGKWTNAKIVMVDIDIDELNKQKITLKIHSDVGSFIKKFKNKKVSTWLWNDWLNRIQTLRKEFPLAKTMPYKFINKLSDYSGKGDIIITDAGQTLTWTMQAWKIKENQLLFSAFNHSPMGYSVPASIGAQVASPTSRIICLSGDGGFQMNLQELQTIKGYNLPIKIFVIDNSGYGMIKQGQSDWPKFLKYSVACNPPMESLERVAKAFGFEYEEILDDTQFDKIKKVLDTKCPIICRVVVPEGTKIEPKLFFGDEMWNTRPYLSKEDKRRINETLNK